MRSVKSQQRRRVTGGHSIKIGGKMVNNYFARIAYRCADCLGELEIHGAGVRCKARCGCRRFITKAEAEEIKENQREQMAEVESAYEIINGQIVYKENE